MRGPVVALALCVAFSVPLSTQSPGTPAGTVLEFPIAYPNQPSDGNIWFTELGSNKVGKLFTAP